MTYRRWHPVTIARHEALRSPLPRCEQLQAADAGWLPTRADLFRQAAGCPFDLTLNADDFSRRTGLAVHSNDVAHAYWGSRVETPLLIVNLALATTRLQCDQALAHEVMHLLVPSYGHKQAAFARAQAVLDRVGELAVLAGLASPATSDADAEGRHRWLGPNPSTIA